MVRRSPANKDDERRGRIVDESKIDLMLVIGTSAQVFPAARYVWEARARGARVAVFNMDMQDGKKGLTKQDWLFHGGCWGSLLPELLKTVIGDISVDSAESSG